MNRLRSLATLLTATFFALTPLARAEEIPAAARRGAAAPATVTPTAVVVAPALPPLPEGVAELKFSEFFQTPVGPRGLEITDRLRALDGQRVRVFGYMVKEDLTSCNSCPPQTKSGRLLPAWMEVTVAGRMMFTAAPSGVSHAHYGLADDLPPQTVFVTVPDKFGELVPYTPGPLLLTGTLSVGNKEEPDKRLSVVRLKLDPPAVPALSSATPVSPQANKTQPTHP